MNSARYQDTRLTYRNLLHFFSLIMKYHKKKVKKKKCVQIGREDIKLSLYADNMILYVENPKDSAQKLLELINSARYQDTRLTYRNLLHFFTLKMKYQKGKVKKKIPFKIAHPPHPKKILRNKPDQGGEKLICWEL